MLGRIVTVTVDRPLGSYHPEYNDMYYHINYGYIAGIMAPDGMKFTKEEMMEAVRFQEQYFHSEVITG